jgi:hypothetical protein
MSLNSSIVFTEYQNRSSFRGALHAEESLCSSVRGKEGFLTPFGMTMGYVFRAKCVDMPFEGQIAGSNE